MRGIKILLQDFALKMQGGLMREGGRICGTLRYLYRRHIRQYSVPVVSSPDPPRHAPSESWRGNKGRRVW